MPTPATKLAAIASSDRITASQLVRFCSLAASKLSDQEMIDWCREELGGCEYEQIVATHPYRMVYARLEATDRWGRAVPAYVEDPKDAKHLSEVPFSQRLSEVEALVANARPQGHFQVAFKPEMAAMLRKGFQGAMDIYRVVQTTALLNILAGVREHIFNWALGLTERGVSLPDDVSFDAFFGGSGEAMAGNVPAAEGGSGTVINITGASHSPIQVAGSHSQQTAATSSIDSALARDLVAGMLKLVRQHEKVDPTVANSLRAELENVRAVLDTPQPKQQWLREGLTTVRSFLESAAGSALYEAVKGAGLVAALGKLLGM